MFNTSITNKSQTMVESTWTASELTILDFIFWVDSLNPLSKTALELSQNKLKDIEDIKNLLTEHLGKFNLVETQNQLLNNLVTNRSMGNNELEKRKFQFTLPSYIEKEKPDTIE